MSKMGSHCSFGHLKHKLWLKEGPKVRNRPDLLGYRWCATYCWKVFDDVRHTVGKLSTTCDISLESSRWRATYRWKALNESYNFASDRTSIRGLLTKLWGSKVTRILIGAISGEPGERSHLDVSSVERCRVNYKGEGGGFPQVRAVVSLVCPCCSWLVLAPKVFQLCTNHLVWVVCKPVWVSEACQHSLVPSRSSNTPFYPSKCYELGNVPQLLPLLLSCTWTHFWVL